MKKASAIVTNRGGRTSHAAIVARELGIPAVVGCGNATEKIQDGWELTVDCASGKEGLVFKGLVPFTKERHRLDALPETRTKVCVNISTPQEALRLWRLPVAGVGLGRLEFIIASRIGVHPNAVLAFEALAVSEREEDRALVSAIAERARGYASPREWYVMELAEGIAQIAVAFYPREVIVRFSDFKTNEYRSLLGGGRYEPVEENPMLGWRGASRYTHRAFRAAFGLECEAIDRVRRIYGLENVSVLIPFVRTPEEGKRVLGTMAEFGLGKDRHPEMAVYVMAELPANVFRAAEFLAIADGFSIGSNDLTQLVVGLDRDNERIADISDERDPAVKEAIHILIRESHKAGKYCGICGQAPSDYPELLHFLVREGISAISLAPDTVIPAKLAIARAEGAR